MNIRIRLLGPLLAVLALAACSGGMSGTYAENDSALKVKFESSGKAYVTGLGSMETKEATYKVDGDKIIVDGPGGHLQLTRNKDGTLHVQYGGTLTKTDAGSGS
jgi:hypothetical protein